MELFNAIFETFWTFAGAVILVSLIGTFTAATFHGISLFRIGSIDKSIDKSMNKKGSE